MPLDKSADPQWHETQEVEPLEAAQPEPSLLQQAGNAIVGAISDGPMPSGFQDPRQQEAPLQQPLVDPIDLIGGAAGAKLGGVLAKDAGAILGNEIGSVGKSVAGYMDRLPAAQTALREAQAALVANPNEATQNAVTFALQKLKAAERLANRNKFAKGGTVKSGFPKSSNALPPQLPTEPSWDDTTEIPQAQPSEPQETAAPSWDDTQDLQSQYGTPGQQAIAGLEGAAQGLVGPLAPLAERGLGVDPEAIRARAEANPVTHYGSEIAGLVLPAIASGGSSAAASTGLKGLAKFTQAGIAEAAAKKLLPEVTTTLAGKIGVGAAKAAIENMLISGSDEVSKMILKDPQQSAASAIANVGLAGALGGALGGGLSATGSLWKATVGDKASKLIEDFKGRIAEHLENPDPVHAITGELGQYYNQVQKLGDDVWGATGLKSQDISKALPELNTKIADQAQDTYSLVKKSIDKMVEKPQAYPARLVDRLQNDLSNFEQAMSKEDISSSDVFNATQDLKQTLQGYAKYDKMVKPVDEAYDFVNNAKKLAYDLRGRLEDTGVWGKAAERQMTINKAFSEYLPTLKDFEKKFTTEVNGERIIDPGKINTYLNQNGKPNAEIKQMVLKNFLDQTERYKKVIGDSHANLGIESPVENAPMNATLRTLKEETTGGKLADAFIEKGLKAGGASSLGATVGGSIGGVLGGIPGAGVGAILGQHALTPFFNSVLPAIAKGLLNAPANVAGLKGASELGIAIVKGAKLMDTSVKAVFKGSREVLPTAIYPQEKNIMKLDRMVRDVAQNPDLLMRQTSTSAHYMPDTTSAIDETKAQALMYLNQMRPNEDKLNPLDSKPIPSSTEKAKYENALKIAESPMIILDKVKEGTLTHQDITDLGSMYPALYNGLKSKLLEQVVNAQNQGEVIPYKTKMSLSMFLAQPLDSTMTPSAIQAAQVQTGPGADQQSQQESPKGVKSSPALQKLGQSYQTPGQSRQQRAQKS